jgi:hypothetical protein
MVKKRADTSRSSELPESDDLKRITGIGPAVERRLHGVGIYTFSQLANLSAADIAAAVMDLTGLTAERIVKQDWIGQARELAAASKVSESQQDSAITIEHQNSATFMLELLLDIDNSVRRSHISHIESGGEDTWDGWQNEQLVEFLVQHAKLNLPLSESVAPTSAERKPPSPIRSEIEPTAPAVEEAEVVASLLLEPETVAPIGALPISGQSEVSPPVVATSRSTGVLHLGEMVVVATDAQGPQNFLRRGKPFSVHLTLDLSDINIPKDAPLSIKVSIYGKSLEGQARQTIGEASDIITSTDRVAVNIEGRTLPTGIYRLETEATLQPLAIEPTQSLGSTAAIDGDLLVIF